jgi:hypothetical protein
MTSASSPSETSTAGSRRRFLTAAAAVSLVPVAGLLLHQRQQKPVAASLPSDGNNSLPQPPSAFPSLESFQSHIGSEFTTTASDEQPGLRLKLAKVEQHSFPAAKKTARASGKVIQTEQFSLRFQSVEGERLTMRSYDLRHDQLGALQVFISSIGPSVEPSAQDQGQAFVNQLITSI